MADKYTNQEEARRQAAKGSFQAKDIKHTGISKTQTDKTGGDRRSADTDGILDLTLTFLPLHEVIEKIKADLASQNAVLLRKVDKQEETIRELEKQKRNTEVEQQSYKTTTGASFQSENKQLKNKLDEVQVEYTKLKAAYKDLDVHATERLKNAEGEINTLKSDQKSQEGTLQALRQQARDADDTIKTNRNMEIEQQRFYTTTCALFESENKRLKNKLDEVKVEYTKNEAAYKDLESRANERLKKAEGEIKTLKTDQKSQEGTLQALRQQVRDAEDTIKKNRNMDIEQQRNHTTRCASFESEKKRLKNKLDEVKIEYTKNEAAYKELNLLAKERLKKAEGEINTLKSDQKSQEGALQVLRQQVRDAEDAKQNALTRLSKQMGHQLTDGDPGITDPSDANRPTALGERFEEVYDKQWTEALKQIQGSGYSDRDFVQKLLEILKNCNTYACRAAENKLDELKKVLGISGMKHESDHTSQEKEVMSILKNLRKQMTAHFLPDLVKASLRRILTHMDKATVAYAKECFELCWHMAVCDPPMQLEFNGTGTFDKTLFQHFTATGNVIDYVVWPVVYLHVGGPVVSKGVAQPYPYHSYNKHRETTGTPSAYSLYPHGN